MNDLKPVSFLVPVIALILVVVLFIFLLKESGNKAAFKRFTFIVTGLAFLLNFAWEVIQMPLYKGASYDIQQIAFCALASMADAIMVLMICFVFALIYKDPFWTRDLTWQRILNLMMVGGLGAIGAEIIHLSSGNWAYARSMPIIPVVNAGLSPVLQFMILPGLIYYLSFQILERIKTKKKTQFIQSKNK